MISYGMIRGTTRLIAALGVGQVVGNIVKATTPVAISGFKKVLTDIGCFVLGSIAGDVAADYVSDGMDQFFKKNKEVKTETESK